ncbi:MAG: hypothetical protein VYC42_07300 [Pseudomonadota bacterium]|nr:hypothetical protein [Pseudomonadota bacterium]
MTAADARNTALESAVLTRTLPDDAGIISSSDHLINSQHGKPEAG